MIMDKKNTKDNLKKIKFVENLINDRQINWNKIKFFISDKIKIEFKRYWIKNILSNKLSHSNYDLWIKISLSY